MLTIGNRLSLSDAKVREDHSEVKGQNIMGNILSLSCSCVNNYIPEIWNGL